MVKPYPTEIEGDSLFVLNLVEEGNDLSETSFGGCGWEVNGHSLEFPLEGGVEEGGFEGFEAFELGDGVGVSHVGVIEIFRCS